MIHVSDNISAGNSQILSTKVLHTLFSVYRDNTHNFRETKIY